MPTARSPIDGRDSEDIGILQETVGVFGQLEFARKGGMTAAVGVKGSYGVINRADLTAKGAVYVSSDAQGNLTDAGFKGTVEGSESFTQKIEKVSDDRAGSKVGVSGLGNLAVDFVPSFVGPSRGPDLRRQ